MDSIPHLTEVVKLMLTVQQRLANASKEIFRLAIEKAEKERDYRVAMSQEMLKLKSEGMAVGMINEVARGNVSELKFQRDVAEALFVAARESISALQTEASILRAIYDKQTEV